MTPASYVKAYTFMRRAIRAQRREFYLGRARPRAAQHARAARRQPAVLALVHVDGTFWSATAM